MVPATRNVISASTLMAAAQNSSSPNRVTEMRFMLTTAANASRAISHCGTLPNDVQ